MAHGELGTRSGDPPRQRVRTFLRLLPQASLDLRPHGPAPRWIVSAPPFGLRPRRTGRSPVFTSGPVAAVSPFLRRVLGPEGRSCPGNPLRLGKLARKEPFLVPDLPTLRTALGAQLGGIANLGDLLDLDRLPARQARTSWA